MSGCCSRGTYGAFFDERLARRDADHYRRRGLRGASRRLVELVAERGVEGATALEIGGGVGAVQIELLARGLKRATNAELSPGYEHAADELLLERGFQDRVVRRVLDVAEDPAGVEAADVVLLHRVVCCYPDYELLLRTAAGKAGRLLAFSFPPDSVLARLVLRLVNLYPRLRGCEFRSYVHPERGMLGAVEQQGFRLAGREQAGVWRIALLERS